MNVEKYRMSVQVKICKGNKVQIKYGDSVRYIRNEMPSLQEQAESFLGAECESWSKLPGTWEILLQYSEKDAMQFEHLFQ